MPIISITSFKGGTAKTSTTLHLGSALALYHKKRILIIDFDAQANLTAGLGFDPDEQDSLAPVLQGEKTLDSVILKTAISNLHLIPGDTWLERVEVCGSLASDRYSHEKLRNLLNPLKQYDYILIDTPPSLCWLTESALIASQYTLVTATPEFYSIKGLQRLAAFIGNISKRHNQETLGVSLSFWNPRGKSNKEFEEVIDETFPNKLLDSRIRRDIAVSEAAIFGKPVFLSSPHCRASEDYKSLTKELLTRM